MSELLLSHTEPLAAGAVLSWESAHLYAGKHPGRSRRETEGNFDLAHASGVKISKKFKSSSMGL